MPKAQKKTKYTLEEALQFIFESESDSEDSLFDPEAEEMFLEGIDPVYDR